MLYLSNDTLYTKLCKQTDNDERIKILNDYNASEIPNIINMIEEVPGDTSILRKYLFLENPELFTTNNYIDAEALFLLDYINRINTCEDNQIRRSMYIGLVDLLEKKVLFNKANNIKIRWVETETVISMYQALIKLFENDKKSLIISGKLYINLYGFIKNKEHASIMFSETIADVLTNSLDFKTINDILLSFLNTLISYDWTLDELRWLIYGEAEFYFKKAMFGLEDCVELYSIIFYIDKSEKESTGTLKEYFIQLKKIILDVVNDSISSDVDEDDTTYISIDELIDKIGILKERYFIIEENIKHESLQNVLRVLDDYADILNDYNQIYSNSTFYKEDLISANEEFGSFLLYISKSNNIDKKFNHINTYVEWCKNIINVTSSNIISIISLMIQDFCKTFEEAKAELCNVMRETLFVDIIGFTDGGFVNSDGTISLYNDINDFTSRKIRNKYESLSRMLLYITDLNYSTYATPVLRILWRLADIIGNQYDGNYINSELEKHIFKPMTSDDAFLCFFKFPIDNIDFTKLFGFKWYKELNKVNEITPLFAYLSLDIIYDTSNIVILDNNSVEESVGDIIIEDFDFSDYDFIKDTAFNENSADTLNPFQVIRKILKEDLNLLKTNQYKLHKLYHDMIYMLE